MSKRTKNCNENRSVHLAWALFKVSGNMNKMINPQIVPIIACKTAVLCQSNAKTITPPSGGALI